MKAFWTALLVACGVFLIVGISLFSFASNTRNRVSQDARTFVKTSAPQFLASDKGEIFLSFAAPELRANTTLAAANAMFSTIRRRIGRFQGLTKVILGSTSFRSSSEEEGVFVDFRLEVDYDKGNAEFDAVVVRARGQWRYAKLQLTSNLLE